MPKSFLLFVEDESVTGFQIMDMLKKLKCYHHVSDLPKIEAAEQTLALDTTCACDKPWFVEYEDGEYCKVCGKPPRS